MTVLENIFVTLIGISIPISIIISIISITTPLMKKKYAAKWRYMIWIILSIRLIIPLNIALPSSPVNITVPENTITFGQPDNTENFNQINTDNEENEININNKSDQKKETQAQTASLAKYRQPVSVWNVFAIIWLVGMIFFILRQMLEYISFKKKMKRWSRAVTNREIIETTDRLCADLKIKRKPVLKWNKNAPSPLMYGFINPVLVLQNGEYEETDSEVILKHELVHYKRHDLWYKLILLFANIVHWCNPLVYLMMKSANDDMEYSCDDEVVKNADISFRKKYSQAILNSMHRGRARNILLSTQFKGGKKNIKKRFANILDTSKKRNGVLAICVVLVLFLTGGLLVSFKSEKAADETWKQIYSEFLAETETYNFNGSIYEWPQLQLFYLYDITGDGTPELIFRQLRNNSINDFTFYTCENGGLKELFFINGDIYDIRQFLVPKESNGLYYRELRLNDGYRDEIYSALRWSGDALRVEELGSIHMEYNDDSVYTYTLTDGRELTQKQFEQALNIQSELYYSNISDFALQTMITGYVFNDSNISLSDIRSNPTVSVFDLSPDDEYRLIDYSNGLSYEYNSENMYPLVMLNGSFVDKGECAVINEAVYVGADFLKANFSITPAANNSVRIGKETVNSVNRNGTLYYPLESITEISSYSIQYITNSETNNISIVVVEKNLNPLALKYSVNEALFITQEAFDQAYRVPDSGVPEDMNGANLYFSGMFGRYYMFKMADSTVEYFILFNPYTGEIYEKQYGLPIISIKPGLGVSLGGLFRLYQ